MQKLIKYKYNAIVLLKKLYYKLQYKLQII